MSSPLERVRDFRIDTDRMLQTLEILRDAGRRGFEAFVLWGGRVSRDGHQVVFDSVIAPAQTAHKTAHGLLVTVDGEALFDVNRTLYSRGEVLAGQIHSHPTDAYHSDTDDHNPLVTLTGALSLVIPDFAFNAPGDIERWAWYRLVGTGKWDPLTAADRVEINPGTAP
ncbi:UNVERIFIED_ORG: hypothetical protein E4P37_00025 [Bacillus sp. AZ43]